MRSHCYVVDSGKINQRVTYRKNLAVPRVLRNAAIPDEADRLCYSMAEGREVVPFWVAQDITELESAIPAIKENKSRFIHRTNNIKRQHCLIHVMFLARNDDPPPPECGAPGDIWIATTFILLRAMHGWVACDTKRNYSPRHPILERRVLCLHPRHLALQWALEESDRRWYSKADWSLGAMRRISLDGLIVAVSSPDLRPLLDKQVGDLGSEDMARFLHAVLPLFLPRERRVGAITGAGSVSRSSLQSEGPGPEPSIDSGIRSQSPPSLSRSTTLSLFTAVQHGGNLISTPKNVGGYIGFDFPSLS